MFWDLRISYFFERKVIFLETGNQFLGTERVSKLMRQYAIPCIISLLVGALYNIVDQIFIANASYLGSYGNPVSIEQFGLQGDGAQNMIDLGITAEHVVEAAKASIAEVEAAK